MQNKIVDNINFSKAETCLIMEPAQANSMGNVHGGELMKLMDTTAGIAAAKHALGLVVTARADELVFHKAIHVGDIVTCIAQVAYVGKTSLQVLVNIMVHEIKNYAEPTTALTAFFTMVHIDEEGKPKAVPPLKVVTKEEKYLFALGEYKYQQNRNK